ncbi:MAG: 3-oxoacyl-ACP reductase FabG [bacterium]
MLMGRLAGRAVLVTGGSRGIGRSCVELAAAEGARVAFTYRADTAAAEATTAAVRATGVECLALQADGTDRSQVQAAVQAVVEAFDRIDVLINNAGIIRDQLMVAMEPDDWNAVLATNLGGTFHFTQEVAQPMMLQKAGRIINLSSAAASQGGRGQANYAASKAAIEAFTRACAVELAPKGITVNAVAPGLIETDMSREVRSLLGDRIREEIALRRFGMPEEVARVVLFLASDEATYITGQVIHVDGGLRL